MFCQLSEIEIFGPRLALLLSFSLQAATCSIISGGCLTLLVMGKEVSATLPVDFQPNSGWRHRSLQPYVSSSALYKCVLSSTLTQIDNLSDAILSFATIALAMKVPRMADAKAQQMAVVIWGVILLGMYSFLLSIFKAKNAGYPFFLPPF